MILLPLGDCTLVPALKKKFACWVIFYDFFFFFFKINFSKILSETGSGQAFCLS